MKCLKSVAVLMFAIVLSVNCCASVCAANSSKNEQSGYYYEDSLAAVVFRSWDDYLKYSGKVADECSDKSYIGDYDFMYIPKPFADKTDNIREILITPRYCLVSFDTDDGYVEMRHYYADDNKKSNHEYSNFAETSGELKNVNGINYYKYENLPFESNYYCRYNGAYFSFSTKINLDDMGKEPFVKVYFDSNMQEINNNLYYLNDNGKYATGWKTVNGHKYYFAKGGKAIKGRKAVIGGYLYDFNANGVCKGKYTGYVKKSNGSKVYYKDGKAA